jgi:hypothetical protein
MVITVSKADETIVAYHRIDERRLVCKRALTEAWPGCYNDGRTEQSTLNNGENGDEARLNCRSLIFMAANGFYLADRCSGRSFFVAHLSLATQPPASNTQYRQSSLIRR